MPHMFTNGNISLGKRVFPDMVRNAMKPSINFDESPWY